MAEAGKSTHTKRHRAKSEPGSTRVAGGARLKKAAAQQLRKNGVQLAKALMDKALEGNVASARMVVELAEVKEEEKPKRRPRGLTEAQRLAMQPEWGSLSREEQKRILIRRGEWDFEHDCREGEWVADELRDDRPSLCREQRGDGAHGEDEAVGFGEGKEAVGAVEAGGAVVEGVNDDHGGTDGGGILISLAEGGGEKDGAESLALKLRADGEAAEEGGADLRIAG